jgi:hypothetical protein
MHKTANRESSLARNGCLTTKNLQTQRAPNLATHSSTYHQSPVKQPNNNEPRISYNKQEVRGSKQRLQAQNHVIKWLTKITHQMHETTDGERTLSFAYHRSLTEKNPYIEPTVHLAIHRSACHQGV